MINLIHDYPEFFMIYGLFSIIVLVIVNFIAIVKMNVLKEK